MKLDKRILTGRKYWDCFDTDTAMQFLNQKCYFGEDITDFENISKLPCSMLYSVDNSSAPYEYYKEGIFQCANFILPCAWVKNELKYRPYTLEEFKKTFMLGQVIQFRAKNSGTDYLLVFNGFIEYHDGNEPIIVIGQLNYSFKELFNDYEWIDFESREYQPFGVKD